MLVSPGSVFRRVSERSAYGWALAAMLLLITMIGWATVPVQAIPDEIVMLVTNLKVGDHLTMAELPLPEGAKLLDDPETVVASVRILVEEEVEAPAEGEEEAAEPEVIGETEGAEGEDSAKE